MAGATQVTPATGDSRMMCVVPPRQLRMFAKMLVCISKIADEFTVDASGDGLVFRAANPALSAFFSFVYKPKFFDVFVVNYAGHQKVKVQTRLCTPVVHAAGVAETLALRLNSDPARLVFEMQGKYGIRKVFELCIEDTTTVRAIYNRDQCPNLITAVPHYLLELINNTFLDKKLAEVSLTAGPRSLEIRSYVDELRSDTRAMQTAVTMQPSDFETYTIRSELPCDLTFPLKEFKAALGFCDLTNTPMSVHFDRGAKPLVLRTTIGDAFEADFVIATLVDPTPSQQPSQQSVAMTRQPQPPQPASLSSSSSLLAPGGALGAAQGTQLSSIGTPAGATVQPPPPPHSRSQSVPISAQPPTPLQHAPPQLVPPQAQAQAQPHPPVFAVPPPRSPAPGALAGMGATTPTGTQRPPASFSFSMPPPPPQPPAATPAAGLDGGAVGFSVAPVPPPPAAPSSIGAARSASSAGLVSGEAAREQLAAGTADSPALPSLAAKKPRTTLAAAMGVGAPGAAGHAAGHAAGGPAVRAGLSAAIPAALAAIGQEAQDMDVDGVGAAARPPAPISVPTSVSAAAASAVRASLFPAPVPRRASMDDREYDSDESIPSSLPDRDK